MQQWEGSSGVVSAIISMQVFRWVKHGIYRAIGLFRPGWRRALPILKELETVGDNAFFRPGAESAEMEIRMLRDRLKRTRRGLE